MPSKIIALRQFYTSPLGHKVKQRLRAMVKESWADEPGDRLVGVGYATPLLRVLEHRAGKAQTLAALMPEWQGAMYWPVHADNRSVLGDALCPPFAPSQLDRVIMLHALEHAAKPEELLAVWFELLAPGGRLFLIVPNRHGLWARSTFTPFATGTPYRMSDLRALLEVTKFTVRRASTALYAPPSSHPFFIRCFMALEWIGRWCFPGAGGVLVVEAEKQIYAGVGERAALAQKARWSAQGAPVATPRTQ